MPHPNNIPRANGHQPRPAAEQQPVQIQLPPLGFCTGCVADRKGAEATGVPADRLPPLAAAICMVGGTGSCYGHLAVQQHSPLAGPNGMPISRQLLGPNGMPQ